MTKWSGIFSFTEIQTPVAITCRRDFMNDLESLLTQLSASSEQLTLHRVVATFESGTRMFVARADSRIIGVVLLCRLETLTGTEDWIKNLVVDEEYRTQGVASNLMAMAEQASRETGADELNLVLKPERMPAIKLYEKRGYKHHDSRYVLQLQHP